MGTGVGEIVGNPLTEILPQVLNLSLIIVLFMSRYSS